MPKRQDTSPTPAKAKKVRFSYSTADQPRLQRVVIQAIERIGGQRKLKKIYEEHQRGVKGDENFFAAALHLLKMKVEFDAEALARTPAEGPVLFIANHPYGVLDGITLTWLATKVRPDTKVLANDVLCQAPEASENLLPVAFAPTREARETNVRSRLAAQTWLREGHAVGIFPGGGVSTSERPLKGPAVDLPWAPFTAKLLRQSRATVVPVFFVGQNSRLFQLASHLSLTLRLSLVFRETARRIVGKRAYGACRRVACGEQATCVVMRVVHRDGARERRHLAASRREVGQIRHDEVHLARQHEQGRGQLRRLGEIRHPAFRRSVHARDGAATGCHRTLRSAEP